MLPIRLCLEQEKTEMLDAVKRHAEEIHILREKKLKYPAIN